MNSIALDNISTSLLGKELEQSKYDANTLSHRLKLCLRLKGMSQSELARLINVKPQIIQYLCTKNVVSSKFTFELAEALGVDYTWLSTGEGAMRHNVETRAGECKIPFFPWYDLNKIENLNSLTNHCGEFIHSSLAAENSLIASKMDDSSMEPRFEKGTTLIIDLADSPKPGDFVLAKLEKINIWLFRQYVYLNNDYLMLSPINQNLFKDIIITPEVKILGVLIQTICNFKRDRS